MPSGFALYGFRGKLDNLFPESVKLEDWFAVKYVPGEVSLTPLPESVLAFRRRIPELFGMEMSVPRLMLIFTTSCLFGELAG